MADGQRACVCASRMDGCWGVGGGSLLLLLAPLGVNHSAVHGTPALISHHAASAPPQAQLCVVLSCLAQDSPPPPPQIANSRARSQAACCRRASSKLGGGDVVRLPTPGIPADSWPVWVSHQTPIARSLRKGSVHKVCGRGMEGASHRGGIPAARYTASTVAMLLHRSPPSKSQIRWAALMS